MTPVVWSTETQPWVVKVETEFSPTTYLRGRAAAAVEPTAVWAALAQTVDTLVLVEEAAAVAANVTGHLEALGDLQEEEVVAAVLLVAETVVRALVVCMEAARVALAVVKEALVVAAAQDLVALSSIVREI